MKKNIIALNFSFFLILAGAFYLLTYQLVKYKTEDLENLTIEKARSAVRVSVASINRAIQNSDDISLLTNIESISKLENVTSAFILDRNNAVIIHNNTNEWNSMRKGDIYDRSVSYDGELLQLSYDNDHILFSSPLTNDYTLCCIFSMQKANENAKYWTIKYFTVAAITAVILIFILYFLSKLFVIAPFNRTKKKIEQVVVETYKDGKYDEIADMFATENEKSLQKIKSLQDDKKKLTKIIEYYLRANSQNYQMFIILDSSNNIIYAYDKMKKFLKEDFTQDSNILEASANAEILQLISKSSLTPETEITEIIDENAVTSLSLGEKENIFATILSALKTET
ncbi:MAG: hypothetical protein LBD46_08025 [Endomicrobium sp.]|jgi:hypothetical protein|nr:hypothetical protein [Endomicrobium sp.]